MERPKKISKNITRFSFESSESSTCGGEASSSTEDLNSLTNNENESDCTVNNSNSSYEKPTFESIYKSIPNDILEKIKEQKVKYAFLTKGTMMSTSKQHKFKQHVSIESAIKFLAEAEVSNATLVFINESSLIFSNGVYYDLDEFDESD